MQNIYGKPVKTMYGHQPPPLPKSQTVKSPPTDDNSKIVPDKKRKILNYNARELVSHVVQMCELEKAKNGLVKPLSDITGRASFLTGVSEETIINIKNKNWKPKESEDGRKNVEKKKKEVSDHKIFFDDRDIIQIKNVIRDYHIKYCKVPSVKELLPLVMDQIPLEIDNVKFLHQILRNIGYKRKKLHWNQTVLVEDPSTVASRDDYLKTIRDLRNDSQNIFYIYECVVNQFYTLNKTWVQKHRSNEALSDNRTYTLICVASIKGFLKKATLLRKTSIDESLKNACGQLTPEIFENWLQENLIPNLPKNSVIIMDDAPHHCTVADKPLSYYASKRELMEYLKSKNIKSNEKMRRSKLFELVKENTPKCNTYIVDDILGQHQHKAMHLPPHMIDLSPAQLAMDQIQQELYADDHNGAFSLKNVTDVFKQVMGIITQEEWEKFFETVKSLEDDYWKKDGEFEVAYDNIMKNMRDRTDFESDESSEDSDADAD